MKQNIIYRLIAFIVVWVMATGVAAAQQATVKRMELSPMDLSAATYPRKDINGNPCALIKVEALASDLKL